MRRIYNNLTFEEFANDKKTVLSVTKYMLRNIVSIIGPGL
jgi:hypothetical protein